MHMKWPVRLLLLLCLLLPVLAMAESAGDFSALYPDKFLPEGSAPIRTENSYQSDDVNLTITSMRTASSDVYVADIYVRTVECFQRAFGDGQWGKKTERVRVLSENNDAILAMIGDSGHYFSYGWVVANGQVLRDHRNRQRDLGVIYRSGEMVTIENEDIDNNLLRAQTDADEIWHIFLFGPAQLDAQGKAKTVSATPTWRAPTRARPLSTLHRGIFVQVDGRGAESKLDTRRTSRGMELDVLAELMESLGCKAAYNLDGGQSSMLVYGHQIISSPYHGGRSVGDILLIKDLP